jgi:hypothetical protein
VAEVEILLELAQRVLHAAHGTFKAYTAYNDACSASNAYNDTYAAKTNA